MPLILVAGSWAMVSALMSMAGPTMVTEELSIKALSTKAEAFNLNRRLAALKVLLCVVTSTESLALSKPPVAIFDAFNAVREAPEPEKVPA